MSTLPRETRYPFTLFCFLPVEVVFEDEADALNHSCLAQGVFVHGVGVAFEAELAVRRKEVLNVQVAEERLISDVIVAVAEVTVDDELVNGLELEDGFVLLRGIRSLAVGTDIEAHSEDIGEFGEPVIDLPRYSG